MFNQRQIIVDFFGLALKRLAASPLGNWLPTNFVVFHRSATQMQYPSSRDSPDFMANALSTGNNNQKSL